MIHKATYNTLVTLDENDISVIVPDLATSWEISPDAKVFTFHLRQGVKFQTSGNTMTSADVKWSLERAIAIKGNPSFLLDGIVSVDAPDANTVKITKSDADPAFIAKGTFPVFSVLDSISILVPEGAPQPPRGTFVAAQWMTIAIWIRDQIAEQTFQYRNRLESVGGEVLFEGPINTVPTATVFSIG